ncbi:MAG: heavy metal translocating P-type ATPase [Anaerolineales bacterium]|nr:heavy metal translocating P-type ATPase [Anaerolineales bacterium]
MSKPSVPEHDSCLSIIHEATHAQSGILAAHIDPVRAQMTFDYDARQLSEAEVARFALELAPTFQKRFEDCALRLDSEGRGVCESCVLLWSNRLNGRGVRPPSAGYLGGVFNVSYPAPEAAQVNRYVQSLEVRAAPALPKSPSLWARLRQRFPISANQLEAALTAVTLVAMLGGWLAEQLGANAAVVVACYAVAYAAGGAFGLKGGLEALRERKVDIDLLMVLAAIGAWLVGAPFEGAMLLFLFSLSNALQAFALDRTRNAIRALMKLRPTTALVRRSGRTAVLPIERIVLNDIILVRPGERIPMDGVVIEGESAVDQSPITGESMPIHKQVGDTVLAGTVNTTGGLEVRVTRLAQDSTLARMIKLVEEAHSQKAKTQRWLDAFEQRYAAFVIAFTAVVAVVPLFFGEAFNPAFYRAMTVMVAASPCALIISTPASILSAIGNGARRGILFKGGIHVEQAAAVKVVAFDKTGTLTEGKPHVTDISDCGFSIWHGVQSAIQDPKSEILRLAASVEAKSEHPLAKAIVQAAQERGLTLAEVTGFQSESGQGVRAIIEGQEIAVGNARYFNGPELSGREMAQREIERLQMEGKTTVLVARLSPEPAVLGVIAIADVLRRNAAQAVRELKAAGVERVVMLTGDHARVAEAIGREAGVDAVHAELLPEDKLRLIRELRAQYGPVAMVGDGVNDAPALATADLGIAMGAAGTDVALETADVVLMSDDLRNLPYVIALSRATRRTLVVNLAFAMLMIALMLVSIFFAGLSLPLAVIGHEGGTVLVSLNGLRLLAFRR